MKSGILTYTLPEPPIDRREILRYARGSEEDAATAPLLDRLLREARPQLDYRASVLRVSASVEGDTVTLGPITVLSRSLAAQLAGAREALLVAATVGAGIDRLILRYSRLSPASALLLEAIGSERAEALISALEARLCEEHGSLTRRFSPGYGDLPLSLQGELFSLLDCERRLGLTLGAGLLMSPRKSVTAIMGILD